MLLRNESRIIHSINIKLVFDDNRTRELVINEYDHIQVSYRKNGCIQCGVGIIRKIKPYVHSKRFPFCKRASAIITLDMSEDLVSWVDKFDLYDIIDIRKIEPQQPDEEIDPDFTVNNSCCENCPMNKDESSDNENTNTEEENIDSSEEPNVESDGEVNTEDNSEGVVNND